MSHLSDRIQQRLETEFSFKKIGSYLREGHCPSCGKKELWTHAETPRIVQCGRLNKCGYSAHIRDLFDDLFKSWSEHHPQSQANPNAAADAYIQQARGLDIGPLQGSVYRQETYQKGQHSSATVRFKITDDIYWERLIDHPERFGHQKAHFNYGAQIKGHWWIYPDLKLENHPEIYITEGIFNAIALNQNGLPAVAALSCNNYPNIGLQHLKDHCQQQGKPLPTLIWAFDNDPAGKKGIDKNHQQATQDGWQSRALLPNPSKTTNNALDWNDLHERQLLSEDHLQQYRHNGKLHLAANAAEAGILIYNHHQGKMRQFDYTHKNRTYWFNLNIDKFNKEMLILEEQYPDASPETLREQALSNNSGIQEICNATFHPLYFQRNDITDESWFYYQIHSQWGTTNLTFTADQLSSRAKFKPRLMASGHGVMWIGNDDILERIIKRKNEGIREVKTIDFIGYSKAHHAYIFGQHAIHQGRIIKINPDDSYKIGRTELKTLAKQPEITLNPNAKFNPDWYADYWHIRGAKGLITLAWWTGSYFAEQIRHITSSYPFIEIVGEAGAGKSRMIEFLWKLSGRPNYEGFDANKSTPVGIYRNLSQVANLPIVLIEGDRNDQAGASKAKISFDEFKDAFNGRSVRSRGIKTSGNETYEPPFRAALMFSQNSDIQASEAILTRTLYLHFDRSGQTIDSKRIVDQLDKIPLETACTYLTHCLKNEAEILNTYSQRITHHENQYHQNGISHTRIALCHAQIAALIDAMAEHILKDHIQPQHIQQAHTMLQHMAQQRINQIGADHPDVEKFWEVYEYMNDSKNIAINHHPDHSPTIAINLNDFYKWAFESRQQLPDQNTLKKLLPTSRRYTFVEKNRTVRSANHDSAIKNLTLKCWIFSKPNGANA